MTTVSTALRMFDQMTQPLQHVTQALNLTISAMDTLTNSANRDIGITNTLNTARGAIQRANSELAMLSESQEYANNSQNRLNDSFNNGCRATESLTNKVKGLVKGYLGFQAVKAGIEATLGGAMGLQQQLFTLQGIMGNKDVATAYFNNLKKRGNESVFAFEDFAANARKYMQFTKNTDSLDKLANLSERLTLMDPTQGLQGAGFALKEMMSGDGVSLKERFGFGKADIEILKASSDMDDFIAKFDTLLNQKGFTENMLEQYNESAAAQFDNLKSNFKTAMAESGEGALEALNPIISRLNEAFSSGTFEPFFNGISIGLGIIATGVGWICDLVTNNWSIIEPILIATCIYIGAMLLPVLWQSIIALGLMAVRWMILNWPIMLVVGAIALVIYVLTQFGITGEQIIGFVGGMFGVFFAFIYNGVGTIWNAIASFAEFFANVFNHPLYSVEALFVNIWNSIVKFVGSAIDAIIGMVKKVPFLGDMIGDFSAVDSFSLDMPEAPSDYVTIPKMEMKDYNGAFDTGYSKGANFASNIGDKLNSFGGNGFDMSSMPDMNDWNMGQGPGNLSMAPNDKLGKGNGLGKGINDANKHLKNIDDKIDISNEHLEMMRDLAEEKSISNFVTLTPTVQVTTGDIKEEADINKIITAIETYMEEELENSAEGLYA